MKKSLLVFLKFVCIHVAVFLFSNCSNNDTKKRPPLHSKPSKELVAFIKEIEPKDSGEFRKFFNETNYAIERDSIVRNTLSQKGISIPTEEYLNLLKKYDAVRVPIEISSAFVYEEKAYCYLRLAKLDSAEVLGKLALDLYKEIDNKQGMARVSNLIAAVFGYKGNFSNSIKYQNEAYQIFESLNDSAGMYSTLIEKGHSLFGLEKFKEALINYTTSYNYYKTKKDTFNMSDVLCSIGSTYYQLENWKASEEATQKALELKRNIDDEVGLAFCLNSLGVTQMRKKNWTEAKDLISKARETAHSVSEYREETTMLYNLGVCEMETNNLKEAKKWFEEGIAYSKKTGMRDDGILKTYERLYLLHEKESDYKLALQNYESYVSIKDSMFSAKTTRMVNELNIKFDLKNKEIEISRLSEEKRIFQLQQILLIVLIVAIFLISALILVFQIFKNRKRKLIFETEKLLKQNQLEAALKEIEYNKAVLTDFTSNLIDRNKVISELEFKLLDTEILSPQLAIDSESMFSLVQSKLLTNQDWTKFKLLFEKAFPEFISNLRNKYTDLTSAEERIFLLLKVKNDTREMADALGISIESVRKGKYRLKKKLNLREEESLDEFIKNF